MAPSRSLNKAVFLDRDGTLIELVDYLNKTDQVALIKGAGIAVRKLNDAHVKVIVITNQSAVAREYLNVKELQKIHKFINKLLWADAKAKIDEFYFCPHHPEDSCDCRKPKPKLILEAALKHNIDLRQSYMVGDYRTDILTGLNAGCKTILVLTGYGESENQDQPNWGYKPDFVAQSLSDAVDLILHTSAGT